MSASLEGGTFYADGGDGPSRKAVRMSTTHPSKSNPAGEDVDRRRRRISRRVRLSLLALATTGCVIGAVVVFGWMVDETHFDRPSEALDEFETQLENLPGVDSVETERWVEAPTFADPTSWVSVTVDEAGADDLIEAACSTDYPDAVTWSILVRTPSATEVSLHAAPAAGNAGGARCPDFGFDAMRLVGELDRVGKGLAIQPVIWEKGRFALVAVEEEMPEGFRHLLPLVEHADDLLAAAGLGANDVVEINSMNLGFLLEAGERERYLAMLQELAENQAVSSYWADGGGAPTDGVAIQLVAPDRQHAAIEAIIRSSGLHIADLPLRFLEQ